MSHPTSEQKRLPILPRLGLETLIGYVSGLSIAPFITIVDKAVVQNASGQDTLLSSFKKSGRALALTPFKFLKTPEQLWILCVYSNTYAAANTIEAFCKHQSIPHEMPKLCGVFLVNMSLSIAKDRALVRLFGTKKPMPVPPMSYAFWGIRDILTVLCAFIIPQRITNFAEKKYGLDRTVVLTTATFWTPILLQFFSTPLHLLGLDYYNNNDDLLKNRIAFLKRTYLKTTLARCARMTPAYGIGGVLNLNLRKHFFEQQDAKKH